MLILRTEQTRMHIVQPNKMAMVSDTKETS